MKQSSSIKYDFGQEFGATMIDTFIIFVVTSSNRQIATAVDGVRQKLLFTFRLPARGTRLPNFIPVTGGDCDRILE